MWVIATTGFYSIVRKPGDSQFCVRARVRKDLVDLKKKYLPAMSKIIDTDNSDYRYRAYADRHDVGEALAAMATDIDYSNFKDEVKRLQGPGRAGIYMRIWTALLSLQPLQKYEKQPHGPCDDMIDRRWRTAFGDVDR